MRFVSCVLLIALFFMIGYLIGYNSDKISELFYKEEYNKCLEVNKELVYILNNQENCEQGLLGNNFTVKPSFS